MELSLLELQQKIKELQNQTNSDNTANNTALNEALTLQYDACLIVPHHSFKQFANDWFDVEPRFELNAQTDYFFDITFKTGGLLTFNFLNQLRDTVTYDETSIKQPKKFDLALARELNNARIYVAVLCNDNLTNYCTNTDFDELKAVREKSLIHGLFVSQKRKALTPQFKAEELLRTYPNTQHDLRLGSSYITTKKAIDLLFSNSLPLPDKVSPPELSTILKTSIEDVCSISTGPVFHLQFETCSDEVFQKYKDEHQQIEHNTVFNKKDNEVIILVDEEEFEGVEPETDDAEPKRKEISPIEKKRLRINKKLQKAITSIRKGIFTNLTCKIMVRDTNPPSKTELFFTHNVNEIKALLEKKDCLIPLCPPLALVKSELETLLTKVQSTLPIISSNQYKTKITQIAPQSDVLYYGNNGMGKVQQLTASAARINALQQEITTLIDNFEQSLNQQNQAQETLSSNKPSNNEILEFYEEEWARLNKKIEHKETFYKKTWEKEVKTICRQLFKRYEEKIDIFPEEKVMVSKGGFVAIPEEYINSEEFRDVLCLYCKNKYQVLLESKYMSFQDIDLENIALTALRSYTAENETSMRQRHFFSKPQKAINWVKRIRSLTIPAFMMLGLSIWISDLFKEWAYSQEGMWELVLFIKLSADFLPYLGLIIAIITFMSSYENKGAATNKLENLTQSTKGLIRNNRQAVEKLIIKKTTGAFNE